MPLRKSPSRVEVAWEKRKPVVIRARQQVPPPAAAGDKPSAAGGAIPDAFLLDEGCTASSGAVSIASALERVDAELQRPVPRPAPTRPVADFQRRITDPLDTPGLNAVRLARDLRERRNLLLRQQHHHDVLVSAEPAWARAQLCEPGGGGGHGGGNAPFRWDMPDDRSPGEATPGDSPDEQATGSGDAEVPRRPRAAATTWDEADCQRVGDDLRSVEDRMRGIKSRLLAHKRSFRHPEEASSPWAPGQNPGLAEIAGSLEPPSESSRARDEDPWPAAEDGQGKRKPWKPRPSKTHGAFWKGT